MSTKEMIVCIVGFLLLAIVLLSPAGCTMHRHYMIEQAIKGGADPIDAKCALEGDTGTTTCMLRAMRVRANEGKS